MQILVVAAHPDDEVLGCGATMARLAGEGHRVHVAILGEGATSRSGDTGAQLAEGVASLMEQSLRAAAILGVSRVTHHGLPDNRFDALPLLDVVKCVEGLLEDVQPAVILTHHGGDLNIDHAITFRAVLTATRPMPGGTVRSLYAYETPSATEWAFETSAPFEPNVFVDVVQSLDAKLQAMSCYAGELREHPHPRSLRALRARAEYWGSVAGLAAAEPLRLVRRVAGPSVAAEEGSWLL